MKKYGLKIILSLIALLIVFLVIKGTKTENSDDGVITIVVINEEKEEVVRQDLKFSKDDTLEDLLIADFDVKIQGGMLIAIEGVEADTKEYFLKIYINDVAANYGIRQINLKNKDVIKIVYSKVGDF